MARFPTIEAWPPRRRPTCSAPGRAWATTGAAPPAALRRGRSWRRTGAGCRRPSRTLERLPGVGPYTARAVAALAFGRRVGAVDVNVRRVVGRIVGGSGRPRRWAGAAPGAGRRTWCRRTSPAAGRMPSWTSGRPSAAPGRRAARSARPGPGVRPPRVGRGRAGSRGRPARARARAGASRRVPRRPGAGCAAGSSTGCARPRTTGGWPSTGRSASTTPRRSRRPPGHWPRRGWSSRPDGRRRPAATERRAYPEAVLRARLPAR